MESFSQFIENTENQSVRLPNVKMSIKTVDGEHIVKVYKLVDNKWKFSEKDSYYTNDMKDAKDTMQDMAKRFAAA
jgi:hypothetical protein